MKKIALSLLVIFCLLSSSSAQLQNKEAEESLSFYNELLNTAKDNDTLIRAYLGKADALYNLSRYKEAISVYQDALYKIGVEDMGSQYLDQLRYGLACAYLKNGDIEQAIDEFQKIVNTVSDKSITAASLCHIGNIYRDSGNYDKAANFYNRVLKEYPNTQYNDYAQYQLGFCLYKQSRYNNAKETLLKFREDFKDSPLYRDAIYLLAENLLASGDFTEAKDTFRSLIKDDPKDKIAQGAYYALGLIGVGEERLDEALKNFNKVLEFADSEMSLEATLAIADIYLKEEKFDLAIKVCKDTLLKFKYLEGSLYPKIGEAYQLKGELDKAIEYFRQALDTTEVKIRPYLHFQIAECLEEQDKFKEALDEYLKITYLYPEDNPFFVKSLLRIAKIYEDTDRSQEAKDIYRRIIVMNIKEADYARERISALGN